MEKCVDSDYLQPENDIAEPQENASRSSDTCLSSDAQEKNERQNGCQVSRVDEKIASQERSSGPSNPIYNGRRQQSGSRRHRTGSRVNVLKKKKKRAAVTARQSVQRKTKIIKSHVPDRLGKYDSSSFTRSETKLPLGDKGLKASASASSASSSSSSGGASGLGGSCQPPKEAPEDGNTKTKIALLGNECLSNKEADRLRNSFESDSETKNIFEKFFDDCLDSTSTREGVSSQDNVNSENHKGGRQVEMTPEKRKTEAPPARAPVKPKDHSSYYSNHKNMRHVCEYCHKIFKSNGKLNSHVYSHTGERPFACSDCGKAFSSKFKLVRHLLIHSEVRKFVCQICDRTFLRNDHLKNHYKVHDPQKKMYKCPKANCDKEYSSVMSHKKHMAYHNVEDGDLKCLICSVKYETKEEVLFHLKSHSGSRLFKTQSDKKFKCDFCDRLFLTRKDVTRHLVVHTGERDFLCQFCPQRFGRKDHLVRHIKKSHGNEDLLRTSEDVRTPAAREETATPERGSNPPVAPQQPAPSNTHPEDKTHILITLQGKPLHNRKKHKKPFHKNELLVPKKKQVPSPKQKNTTTQILLQNIPNILIIPNNSIILLRNQNRKTAEESRQHGPSSSAPAAPNPNETVMPPTAHQLPNASDFTGFNYTPTAFPSPSEFLGEFPDSFSDFHPDLPPFGPHFGEPDFGMPPPAQSDLLPRTDVEIPEGGVLPEATVPPPRQQTTAKEKPGLFDDGNDALMLNESMILNEFKEDDDGDDDDDSSGLLQSDSGILGNILNNPNSENCGFELLRHLLTTDNPGLSPLPGFSQIFQNSNANSH